MSMSNNISIIKDEGIACLHLLLGSDMSHQILKQFAELAHEFSITAFIIEVKHVSPQEVNFMYRLASLLNKEDFNYRIAIVICNDYNKTALLQLAHFLTDYSSMIATKVFNDKIPALHWLCVERMA